MTTLSSHTISISQTDLIVLDKISLISSIEHIR